MMTPTEIESEEAGRMLSPTTENNSAVLEVGPMLGAKEELLSNDSTSVEGSVVSGIGTYLTS